MQHSIRSFGLTLAALTCLAAGGVSFGQSEQPAPATHPRPLGDHVDPRNTILPEIRFDNVALSDVLDFLRDTVPDFQCVLEASEGDRNWPVTMRLKHVTIQQIFDILSEVNPGIRVKAIPGPAGEVWVVHIGAPLQPAPAPAPAKVHHIFSVGAAVDVLVVRDQLAIPAATTQPEMTRNDRLKDVLAMMTSVAETAEPQPVEIKVHGAAEIVTVTGSQKQIDAITEALTAMSPAAKEVKPDEKK